jgi:Fur family iron response transcriptional regulator
MTQKTKQPSRPFAQSLERLRRAGLRPTRQRLALARLLFDGPDRHVTAEQLHGEAVDARVPVSLATVYNTLNQFTRAGLLREVVVESGRAYFDTNISEHHHFLFVDTGELKDLPKDRIDVASLPAAPEGTVIDRVDVIIRLRAEAK